ncbi:MAG: hypothetical protein DRR00_33750 [Candidatus Parabeggiatoa sp. nov. 3]|nr:MAG: hypothetical protein DRR00_33750 [Gammaproteobacteria bacterium]RKZ51683.1 MAG: hypothetical protein DRQ99_33025 [Gammaproteobacteria bacterium]
MTKDEVLEKFGQILMSEVRDEAIEKYEMIAAGTLKSTPAMELNKKLSSFSDEQLSIVRQLVASSIDDVIYHFLWMLEQHEEDIDMTCSEDAESTKENVINISDGLSGELYTEDGWIAKFSNYKENY